MTIQTEHNAAARAALVLSALALTAGPAAATQLPVREMSHLEQGQLSGMPYTHPGNHTFRMAAAVTASAYNWDLEARTTPQTEVQRSNSGGTAAVYRGVGAPPKPMPALLPTVPVGEGEGQPLYKFEEDGDNAQGWATMTSGGVPYLWARGFGGFSVDATASWTTTVTVPAGGTREVVVKFMIPAATVDGATEMQGITRWRAKLRSELLVNGFPAWSNEALRMTIDPKVIDATALNETLVLQQFGTPLYFSTNDEDASGSNNSNGGNTNQPSAARSVAVTLGRFSAGQVIDLSMIHRASAMTPPAPPGSPQQVRCHWNGARYFCSRGSVVLDGSTGLAPKIYFLP